jgi:hypothetical protein
MGRGHVFTMMCFSESEKVLGCRVSNWLTKRGDLE